MFDYKERESIIAAETAAENWFLKMPSGKLRGLGGGMTSRRSGSSHEFLEHRDYIPGDDLRRIDWNVYARSDKLTVKCFQEEVSPYLDILVDSSLSIKEPFVSKYDSLRGVTAFMATAAKNSGFQVRAWHSGNGFERFMDDKGRASSWIFPEFESRLSPHDALMQRAPQTRPNGVVVLVSDLLWMEDPAVLVSRLAREASMLIVIQVLTEEELSPTLNGPLKLSDSEGTGEVEMIVDDSTIKNYQSMLMNHTRSWQECCQNHKGVFVQVSAEEISTEWCFDELISLGILTKA